MDLVGMDHKGSVSVSPYAAIVHVNLGLKTARLKERENQRVRRVDGTWVAHARQLLGHLNHGSYESQV